MSNKGYTDIEKYIKKDDDMALNNYEVDTEITVILVPYKEISYKYDSGYGAYCCELVIDSEEMPDTFKISGNFITQLNIGQTYEAKGKVQIYDRKKQLKVETIKRVAPKTVRTIKQFLKSLEGMGPFYDLIYEEFGENSLDVIRENPMEVKKVAPAIYNDLVMSWQKQLSELTDIQEFLTQLIAYGLKPIQAKHFFDIHKELCIEKIKENPYRLISELDGFGFLKSDTIAKNIGYPPDSEIRINEAIIYVVNTARYNGNTYMTKNELLESVSDLLAIKLAVNDMKRFYKENKDATKVVYKLGNLKFAIDMNDIKKSLEEYKRATYKKDKNDAKLVIFHIELEKIMYQIEYLKLEGRIIVDGERIYDKKLYLAEEFVAQKLFKIESNATLIENIDIISLLDTYLSKKNIKLEEQQYMAVLNSASTIGGFSIINGSAGCVDCDTEFFNGTEWKKISEYEHGESVLQYEKDGSAKLVKPLRYIKNKRDFLWHLQSGGLLDQCLSDNHTCVLFKDRDFDKISKYKFKSIREKFEEGEKVEEYIKLNFKYLGEELKYPSKVLKLYLIILLFNENNYSSLIKIKIDKLKKIEYIEELLKELKIDYNKDLDLGYIEFNGEVIFKENINLYKANYKVLSSLADFIYYWSVNCCFYVKTKEVADLFQFIFTASGKGTVEISKDENSNYCILCLDNEYTKFYEPKIEKYSTKDGFEYCFTVPSNMLILRRNNKIFITGNCGKTFTLNIALKLIEYVYTKLYGYFEPIILAPTGRAARVAANATKREASTIHKALKLTFDGGFYYNAQNNLPYNCIICDETSMLDIELAKYLFEALASKTKVIFIGDTKQLASVGPGNVLKDIINSDKFKVTTLNVAKRQSLDSGIYKNANRIINGEMITSEKETNDAFVYKALENQAVIDKLLKLYGNLTSQLRIDQVQVLVPQKAGLLGTNYLNFILQEKFNPENKGIRVLNKQVNVVLPDGNSGKYELYFKQGDKVIHTENDYKLPWYQLENGKLELDESNFCGVSNGETGKIIKIIQDEDENRNVITRIIVKYDDKFIIYTKDFSQLDHAYAMTIHKSQGSEWPAVLMPITFSSYRMLERNLIYTGYTRSKQWMGVIGDPEAIKYAIETEKSTERQTGLKDRILEAFDKTA